MRIIQIFVKTLTGKTISIDVPEDDNIEAIKRKIEEKEGIPGELQRLVYGGRALDNNQQLDVIGMHTESTIHMSVCLR
jgi:hypothetical protein